VWRIPSSSPLLLLLLLLLLRGTGNLILWRFPGSVRSYFW
jgi:hypothetical protein